MILVNVPKITPEHWGLVNDVTHPCISHSVVKSSVLCSISAMKNRSAFVPLLMVRHFGIRTNAMPLVEVSRTSLPPLPKLGRSNQKQYNIISIPVSSGEEIDALKYSKIRKQGKRSI